MPTIPSHRYRLRAGNLADLRLEDFDLPAPQAGEVRVGVRAIGLNFADLFAIWGLYSATPKEAFTPGLEYAGLIESCGPGVEHLQPGQPVMGVTRFGAYTTYLNIDARYVTPLPAGWDFDTGAAYPVQTLTAYYGLVNLGALQRGQTVLIHSAAGGVGLQALKIVRAYGGFAIGTVGSPAKADFARKEGYDRVLVRGKRYDEDLRAALDGRPLEIVMECIGGRYFSIPYRLLAPMGRMVVYGSARYASTGDRPNFLRLMYHYLTRPRIDPQQMPERNKGVLGFNLIWLYERAGLMRQLLEELDALGLAPPHVGHTFAFEQLPEAMRLFRSGRTIGKVVVRVNGQD